jgi:hypothetical protein
MVAAIGRKANNALKVPGDGGRMDTDKVPFIVTLALAIAGWSATYLVGRITNSPTLEYSVSQPVDSPTSEWPGARRLDVRLTNLTRSSTFKNLTVVLMAPQGTTIHGDTVEMHPVPPAFEGNEPWKQRGGLVQYTIPKVHPGWAFDVSLHFSGDRPPVVRFESEDPVYTTAPSFETWFVRHELLVFLLLAAAWLLAMALHHLTRRAVVTAPPASTVP